MKLQPKDKAKMPRKTKKKQIKKFGKDVWNAAIRMAYAISNGHFPDQPKQL